MTTPVQRIAIDKTLSEATVKFHQLGINHLLVVDDLGKPCGVVSLLILSGKVLTTAHFRPIEQHYDANVMILDSEECVSVVIATMREHKPHSGANL